MAKQESESFFPAVYLLTGYYSGDKPLSKLEPLANTVIFAEEPAAAADDPRKPVVVRTGPNGKLYSISGDGSLRARQLFHAHKDRPVIIPPPDAVSFLAAAKGDSWVQEMIDMAATFAPTDQVQKLKLEQVPYENIRKPEEDAPDDAERDYKTWYDSLPNGKALKAYVLAKTRAIIFTINDSLPIDADIPPLVMGPDNREHEFVWADVDGDYRVGILSGTKKALPDGVYRIEIPVNSGSASAQNSRWNSFVRKSDDEGSHIYRIAEMVSFPITNPAGEFDIVNCDPVTVEESLIVQYPRFYSHLLEAAKSTATKDTKISGQSKKPAKGFLDYCTSWSVIKGKSQLAAGLIGTDIGVYDTEDGHYNGKHTLTWKIAKALHGHMETSQDKKVKATLDTVFATKDGVDAWATFRKARKDYLEALNAGDLKGWREALRDEYFKIPVNSADDLAKYERTIAGKIGIPKGALDIFGKAMNVVDLYSNVSALSKSGYQYVTKTLPNYDKSKEDYKTVAKDYFFWLSEKRFGDSIELRSMFDLAKATVKPEAKQEILAQVDGILESLEEDRDRMISINGHTCDLGGYNYNQSLSERRAKAVMDVLEEGGVDPARMEAEGNSYEHPEAPNTSEANRALNRRVVICAYTAGVSEVSPSREGMGNLERYRNLTVQGHIGLDDQALAMANQATDIALGILAVIPATAPFAAAIALAKAGSQVLVSAGAMLDEVFMDNVLSHYIDQKKKQATMSRESSANQALLADIHHSGKSRGGMTNDILWSAQFRVRAEAIAGLAGLLMRAAMDSPDEPFSTRIRKYHIDAYIENFLLNDQWLYPLNGLSILKMDTYWLFAINEFARHYEKDGYDSKKINFGLDQNNRLTPQKARSAIKKSAIKRLKNAQPMGGHNGGYMMSYAPVRNVEDHLTTNYQGYFPVHYMGTDNLNTFADTFRPVFSDYSKGNYLHTAVYFKEGDRWIAFSDPAHRPQVYAGKGRKKSVAKTIDPFTNIRVLVVFDDKMPPLAPLSFQISRTDGLDIDGPKYKELARELLANDLLPNEQQYAGKTGCIFYPFFQLWDKTYLGIKPLAGGLAMSMFSSEFYYKQGNLRNMRYAINCQVGDNARTKIAVPLDSKPDPDGGIYYSSVMRKVEDTLRVKVDINEGIQSALVNADFLESTTKEFDYPTLYSGQKSVRFAIKVGKDSSYIGFGARYETHDDWNPANNEHIPHFKSAIDDTESSVSGLTVKLAGGENGNPIKLDGFDWKTPVDFAFIATCTKLDTKTYTSQKAEWRKISCETQLFESDGLGDTGGPKLVGMKLCYLGDVTYKSGRYSFDDSKAIPGGGGGDFDLIPIMNIFKSLNNSNVSTSTINQVRSLLGQEQTFLRKSCHVFAAHYQCEYRSPKLVKVQSIRPFGDDVYGSAWNDSYFEFVMKNFNSAGRSGFQQDKIENDMGRELRVDLSLPKSHLSNAPWTKTLPADELREWERKLRPEAYKKIASSEMSKKDWIEWLEKNPSELEPSFVGAFLQKE